MHTNIEIKNNLLINTNAIQKKLSDIYKKNIFFIKKKDIEKPLEGIDFLEKIDDFFQKSENFKKNQKI